MLLRPIWVALVAASHLNCSIALAVEPHMEEVLVSAPLAKSASDSALPIAVLSGERLRQEASASLGATLNNQIGIRSASFGSGVGNPVIRGQGGNRVRVLQDGVGSLDAADVSPDHSYAVEPLLAERIEIIRGPATLLYGNGAVGGVINVIDSRIPNTVQPDITGAMETRHASVNDQSSSVFRLDGGASKWAWHVDGLYRDSNDLSIPGNTIDVPAVVAAGGAAPATSSRGHIANSDQQAHAWTVGNAWIGKRGFIGIAVNQSNNNYGLPPGGDDTDIRLDMQQRRVDVKSGISFDGPVEQLDFRISQNDYKHSELEKEAGLTEVGTLFKNKASEGRLVARHAPISTLHDGTWRGAMGIQVNDRDFSAIGEEAFIPAADIASQALFIVEEYERNRWTYEVGLRGERQRIHIADCNRTESTLSASTSALWAFRDDSNMLLAINRSERSASVEELFSNSQNCAQPRNLNSAVEHAATSRIEIGNPDLKKELSHNLEFGLRKTAGSVTAELSLYRNEIQNFTYLQDSNFMVNGVAVASFKQRNAVFTGYEMQLTTPISLISDDLSVEVFSDHVRARFIEAQGASNADNVPRIPAQRFGMALHYHAGHWSTHLRVSQVRDQREVAENESTTRGYTQLEFSGDYHVALADDREITLFVKARNLLDEEIRSHTSLLKNTAPEAGRNLESGIRFTF